MQTFFEDPIESILLKSHKDFFFEVLILSLLSDSTQAVKNTLNIILEAVNSKTELFNYFILSKDNNLKLVNALLHTLRTSSVLEYISKIRVILTKLSQISRNFVSYDMKIPFLEPSNVIEIELYNRILFFFNFLKFLEK